MTVEWTGSKRLCLGVSENSMRNRAESRGRLGNLPNHHSFFEFQIDGTAELGLKYKRVFWWYGTTHLKEKEICFEMGIHKSILV